MNLLLIYFALILILIVLSGLVILSFWRYRFKGDKTALVISLFVVAFVIILGNTLFLLDPSSLSNSISRPTIFDNF